MRILGKSCCFSAAVILILQGILVLCGYPISDFGMGIELFAMASWCIADAFVYFKKPPKTVKFKNLLTLKNGEMQAFCSDLSIRAKDGAFGPDDVKSIYSEIAEDFEHE